VDGIADLVEFVRVPFDGAQIMISRGVMKMFHKEGRRNRQGEKQQRRGVAAVELAVVSPIFFMLILAMIEFGSAMLAQQAITNAAREGARIAVLPDGSADRAETYAKGVLQSAGIDGEMATVNITDEEGNPIDPALATYGDIIMVRVSLPFSQVSWIPVPRYLGDTILSSATIMRCERTN
jgi:hypothetical protein